jgi:uncharacterized protein YndB with AHSA1/START domain
MAIIKLQKTINADAKTIFRFLSEQNLLMQWFTPQAIAIPLQGTVAAFAFESDVNFKMKITEFTPYENIKWECVDGNVDWIESNVSFSIKEIDLGKSQFIFQHNNLNNETKYDLWKSSWKTYLDALTEKCENFD